MALGQCSHTFVKLIIYQIKSCDKYIMINLLCFSCVLLVYCAIIIILNSVLRFVLCSLNLKSHNSSGQATLLILDSLTVFILVYVTMSSQCFTWCIFCCLLLVDNNNFRLLNSYCKGCPWLFNEETL